MDASTVGPTSNLAKRRERTAKEIAWRSEITEALRIVGLRHAADSFENCGKFVNDFQIVVCSSNAGHKPRPVPWKCNLPFCAECEQQSHIRRVERYVPKFEELIRRSPDGWSLKHIVLTAPHGLRDHDRVTQYRRFWKLLKRFLQMVYAYAWADELSPDERRRQRVDLMKHLHNGKPYAGALVGVEYGERKQMLHAHVGAILPYIDQKVLSDLWSRATYGDAYIVYVKRAKTKDTKKAIQEIVKYATKPLALPPELAPNLLQVLQGEKRRSRRIRAYGALRDPALTVVKEPCRCKVCDEKLTRINLTDYLQLKITRNIALDPEIIALASNEIRDEFARLLRWIRHAKVGEGDPVVEDDPVLAAQFNAFREKIERLKEGDRGDPQLEAAWTGDW